MIRCLLTTVKKESDAQNATVHSAQLSTQPGADPAIGGPGAPPLGLGFCAFTVLKCTKFVLLTLGIITKIAAIRCQILRLKCTKFDFGWAPQTLLQEFTALPRHPK